MESNKDFDTRKRIVNNNAEDLKLLGIVTEDEVEQLKGGNVPYNVKRKRLWSVKKCNLWRGERNRKLSDYFEKHLTCLPSSSSHEQLIPEKQYTSPG